MTCPYQMLVNGKRTKAPFVAWSCGLADEHDGWHHPRETGDQIVTNYSLQAPVANAGIKELQMAELLDREWLAPEDLSARTKLGKLARELDRDGWEVHVGRSRYFTGDTLVKSSNTVKPGVVKEHVWVDAINRYTRQHLTANADGTTVTG